MFHFYNTIVHSSTALWPQIEPGYPLGFQGLNTKRGGWSFNPHPPYGRGNDIWNSLHLELFACTY